MAKRYDPLRDKLVVIPLILFAILWGYGIYIASRELATIFTIAIILMLFSLWVAGDRIITSQRRRYERGNKKK